MAATLVANESTTPSAAAAASATYNPYLNDVIKVFSRCQSLVPENDWRYVSIVDGITLYNKEFPESPIPAYRCSTISPNSQHSKLVGGVWDVNEAGMKCMESSIKKWEIIETVPDCIFTGYETSFTCSTRVLRQINAIPPTLIIWPREAIIVQAKITANDQTWFVTYSLDKHRLVPLNEKKYVRAKVFFNTFAFIKQGHNTLIHKLTLADPCGNIPTGIITMFSNKMVKLLKYLRDFVPKP
jgi:hypothetical protein